MFEIGSRVYRVVSCDGAVYHKVCPIHRAYLDAPIGCATASRPRFRGNAGVFKVKLLVVHILARGYHDVPLPCAFVT